MSLVERKHILPDWVGDVLRQIPGDDLRRLRGQRDAKEIDPYVLLEIARNMGGKPLFRYSQVALGLLWWAVTEDDPNKEKHLIALAKKYAKKATKKVG